MATMRRSARSIAPTPPMRQTGPVISGDQTTIQHWLTHYWEKLRLPTHELPLLAITQDRQEYMRWTGKRLTTMALGCYCYLPAPTVRGGRKVTSTPLAKESLAHRHLIFIEPTMKPQSIEVTIAHELIHLADRVQGTPRRHRHHGYDSIAEDEAAITGYNIEDLRFLLHEESIHREQLRREHRPIRYLYECPNCGKKYPRARRYSQSVSCSSCDKSYNPRYRLMLT